MRHIYHGSEDFFTSHVYFGDKEVSRECNQAFVPDNPGEEAEGWALLFLRNEEGAFYYQMDLEGASRELAREIVHGMIRWLPH